MKHLSLASRIALAFVLVLVCAFALGAVAIDRLAGVERSAEELRAHWLPRTKMLGETLYLAQRFRVLEAALDLAPQDSKAKEAQSLSAVAVEIDQALEKLSALSSSADEKRLFEAITTTWRTYSDLDQRFRRAAEAGYDDAAGDLYRGDMRVAVRALQDIMIKAVTDNLTLAAEAGRRGEVLEHEAYLTIAAMLAIAVALSAATGFGLLRAVARPVALLTRAMTSLSEGQRDVDIPALDLKNELGAMARAAAVFRDDSLSRRDRLEREALAERAMAEAQRETAAAERNKSHSELVEAMSRLGAALRRFANGDLETRLGADFSSVYESIRGDFNGAGEKLSGAMAEVYGSAEAIKSGAKEISLASNDLSERTERQAASLEETAAALDQVTNALRKSVVAVNDAREVVSATDADAKRSGEVVKRAVLAMDAIARSATQITGFIGLIDEIAFQTNLLALNAGVEAARAGDAGKGFAVVASEVRGLALRSAEAAKEIKALVEASGAQVRSGVELVAETGSSLTRIVSEISRIYVIVNALASAARDQASSLDEVNAAIREMDAVTQQNAAMAEQSTAATLNLTNEAGRLVHLVSQFNIAASIRPTNSRRRAA